MKRDEIKKGVSVEMLPGTCGFCKQMSTLEMPIEWSQEDRDEYTVERCECINAEIYTKRKYRIEQAAKTIEKQFGPKSLHGETSEGVRDFLRKTVNLIIESEIIQATIRLDSRTTATITDTEKGIKIKRSDKEEEEGSV
jgi:hypothetical protein